MLEEVKKIAAEAKEAVSGSLSREEIEEVRVKYLGRKGRLTEILKGIKDLTIEDKRKIGPVLNAIRRELQDEIKRKEEKIKDKVKESDFDYTRPGEEVRVGSLNPLTLAENRIIDIFTAMNFQVALGPEVESEYYNFDALNIPVNHPAREMWDTFWLKSGANNSKQLMRTHTSPVQVRFMEQHQPPYRIVVPGRVFRYEATDASHEVNFYQVEGLMVGKEVTLANFKKIMTDFLKAFFKQELQFRFRPSYFPFVEPGVEVDIKMNKGGKWLEVMGAGMVHPKVLEAGGVEAKKWQGFAFGIGVDRLAMLKYDIPDIRLLYSGDLRFIKQF